MNPNDLKMMEQEYLHRDKDAKNEARYSLANPAYRFMMEQLQGNIAKLIKEKISVDISDCRILEIGCGSGKILDLFTQLGAARLLGIDYIISRVQDAIRKNGKPLYICADGQNLPLEPRSFDLVMQFTAISSILDQSIRVKVCQEMIRVLKPGGWVLWYDFWFNPTNHQTHGMTLKEIHRLFPQCSFEVRKVTLAPPISRQIVPISLSLARILEKVKFFNSHYLIAIQP
jgi:ubiquinone/menaquinone biosynthesis C-methylase UbiE